jgi:hypothetical protein
MNPATETFTNWRVIPVLLLMEHGTNPFPPNVRCIFCGAAMAFMACVHTTNPQYANKHYRNQTVETYIQGLRALLHTNFEFPVCETHIDGETQ